MYMIYDGHLKYFYSAGDQKEFLLDHRMDPEETRNCAYNLFYADEVKAMRSELIGFLKSEGYTEPLDGDNWKVFPAVVEPKSVDEGLIIQDAGWSLSHYEIPGYTDSAITDRSDPRPPGS